MANNNNLSFPSAFCQQFFKDGKPLASGKLYTYIAGSSTSVVTYKTISGGTESANMNTNPIILDMSGKANLVISKDTAYKFVLFDRNDVKVDEWDNVTAGGSEGGGSLEEIVVDGTTNEINVSTNITQGVKHYVVSLSNSIKSTILFLLGIYENVVISLENKADKVRDATTGNLAALDAYGNLTDSGSKVSDFKTKQTAVPDPSASGTGLEFISSASQNANGEITTSKKSVQDGTTAQKGVVQLQDSVGATESTTDKAVTPHAVREAIDSAVASAYHAAGTKTVAQLTSALLVSTNEGCVYNVTDSGTTTADFVEGSGHPINAGDNVGICNVGGGVYKFDLLSGFVDLSDYLTKTGDGKDVTSTLTKASGDTSSLTSGSKLSVLFTAISIFFGKLKALAFKDNVSDSDINGTISDNHIASASSWNLKQDALPTNTTPSETYAINVSGNASTATHLSASARLDTWSSTYDSDNPFVLAAEITWELGTSQNNGAGQLLQFEFANSNYALIRLNYITKGNNVNSTDAVVLNSNFSNSEISDLIRITHFKYDSDTKFAVRVYIKFTGDWQVWSIRQLDAQSGDEGYTNWVPMTLYNVHGSNIAAPTGTSATYVFPLFALKAQSGNGNLAVIDSSGNYASSGISAYDQSQINALVNNSVKPWIELASYVQTKSFFIKVNSVDTGHALQFLNAYNGQRLLQLKLNYRYDVGIVELSLRMDIDWNSWIKAGSGGGGTFVTANGTKHTINSGTDAVTPFFDYTETSILSTAVGDVVIGTFDIGQSSVYDTNSYYDFIMNIFNLDSATSVTLKITLMTERIANPGAGTWATLIGMATLDASELNY